jgi:hypothetical protein
MREWATSLKNLAGASTRQVDELQSDDLFWFATALVDGFSLT